MTFYLPNLSACEDLVNDIREMCLFLPISCFVNDMPLNKIRTVTLVLNESAQEDENIRYYAEYLRMNDRTAREIGKISDRLLSLGLDYEIYIDNLHETRVYLESLMGEMSFQDVFPNKAPNWRIYYVSGAE